MFLARRAQDVGIAEYGQLLNYGKFSHFFDINRVFSSHPFIPSSSHPLCPVFGTSVAEKFRPLSRILSGSFSSVYASRTLARSFFSVRSALSDPDIEKPPTCYGQRLFSISVALYLVIS